LWKIPKNAENLNSTRNQNEGKLEFVEISNLDEEDDDAYDDESDAMTDYPDDESFTSGQNLIYSLP